MSKDEIIESLQRENEKLKFEALMAFDSQESWRKKADRWKAGILEAEGLYEDLNKRFEVIANKFSNDNETRSLLITEIISVRKCYNESIIIGNELVKLVLDNELRTQERVDKVVTDWQHLPRWE